MNFSLILGVAVFLVVLLKLFGPKAPVFREGEDLEARLQEFLVKREKINAIHAYRKLKGVGLKDAKTAVELMMEGKSPTQAQGIPQAVTQFQPLPRDKFTPELEEQIARGDTIAAIKSYRELTGASLKDAKEEIEKYLR